jgi:Protein of unknown function (DUF3551)
LNEQRRLPMRFETKVMAALVMVPVVLTQTPASAYDLPYDPYPWCAQYSGDGGGGTNCGFSTIEQCRADVSGIGGFCVRNQFYNPGYASAARVQKNDDTNSSQNVPSIACCVLR